MRQVLTLFAVVAAAVTAVWWWLGKPVAMPASPLGAEGRLDCISYAPFRGEQNPLQAGTMIPRWQIEEDLARLARITPCIRTYSTEHGLDQIPEVAKRFGLKVLQGIWLSSHPDRNRARIEETITLAKRFPDVISAVIVGNEVLLRGELSSAALAAYLREVKGRVSLPVTYADVWEFWVRHQDLAPLTDFVTIHILPYWEDHPVPASEAASHVDAIRRMVAGRFPGKELLIGEVGWPSAGRMREGALPSPSDQARVLHDVLAAARRGNYRVNVIEALDQPWKRRLEGTVGGHWGLVASGAAEPKFAWGKPVSDHPRWAWQAFGGILAAGLVMAAGWLAAGREPTRSVMAGIVLVAWATGVLSGLVVEKVLLESLEPGGWARNLVLAGLAFGGVLVGTVAFSRAAGLPGFIEIIGPTAQRASERWAYAAGMMLLATTVMALQSALGLVFDPRYRDFPYPQLTLAIVPFVVARLLPGGHGAVTGAAERVAAGALALAAAFIAANEGLANWQAGWFSALCLALALILLLRRSDGQG